MDIAQKSGYVSGYLELNRAAYPMLADTAIRAAKAGDKPRKLFDAN